MLAASGVVPGIASGAARRRSRLLTPARGLTRPDADQLAALRVLGKRELRLPGSRPFAALPAGVDTLPAIDHVVVVMMENHSYDNLFGMLGRGPFETPRGDGFAISAADGYPLNSNPKSDGTPLRAFHMPTTCQLHGQPSQEWVASHEQYANGRLDGFVTSPSGEVAMGYWTGADIPFTYSLAKRFPVCDRYFCSALAQTDPNRRFVIAGTAAGMTDDIPIPSQTALLGVAPKNGTIFSRLAGAGLSFTEYYVQYPSQTSATMNLYPTVDQPYFQGHARGFDTFLADAKAGSLPAFSLVGPNFGTQSQEDPQNIVLGDAFLRQVVEAVGAGPKWRSTLLIVTYDEHGGYYDHVPPPVALAPDDIQPVTAEPGQPTYDGFKRYGFRVPTVVVSPYAKPGYVSSVVYDHASILALVERKWNLPAMTLRDANANDLTDCLDLAAMRAGTPTFPELPALAAAGDTTARLACSTSGPGTVPPPTPPPLPLGVRLRHAAASRSPRGVRVTVQASRAAPAALEVVLMRGRHQVAARRVIGLGPAPRAILLRVRGSGRVSGGYRLIVRQGPHTLLSRSLVFR